MTLPRPFSVLLLGSVLFASAFARPTQGNANSGIPQLPGDNGTVGTIYKMGQPGSELLFTLDSATVDQRFAAPDDYFVAGEHQRLVILNFTVQNATNKDQGLGSSTFRFTVVSPDDENYEFRGYLLHGVKHTHFNTTLVPAQKVKCTVVFPIHDSGEIPKLIVRRDNSPVLRYDLTGKLKPFASAFTLPYQERPADLPPNPISPAHYSLKDALGYTPYAKVLAVGPYDFNIEEVSYTTDAVMGYKPANGEQILVIKAKFKNAMTRPVPIGFQYLTLDLADTNKVTTPWNKTLLGPTADTYLSQELAPGDSVTGRYYYVIKPEFKPRVLTFTINEMGRHWKYLVDPPRG